MAHKTDNENLVWKALADENRRKILDFIMESSKVSGEILTEFHEIGFYAVTKHLKILRASGLIITHREGKHYRNDINHILLQGICEKWIKKINRD